MRGTGIGRLAAGGLAALVAACLLVGGLALVAYYLVAPDADGFLTTGSEDLSTDTYAITSGDLELRAETAASWRVIEHLGTARIRARTVDGQDVFVGIGRRADVERYLAASAHVEAVSLAGEPDYERFAGDRRPAVPSSERFWVASASGPDDQTVTWDVEKGDWAVVVMNADASAVVAADVDAAFRSGVLLPIGLAIAVAGVVVALLARGLLGEFLVERSTPPWGGPDPFGPVRPRGRARRVPA